MGEEEIHLELDGPSLETHLVTLFEKLESMRNHDELSAINRCAKYPMRVEVRRLEFWKSVFCECVASFVYVLVVCGAAAGTGVSPSMSSILISTSLSSGFAIATLTQCFGHISGAHINPAVSIAQGFTKRISMLRTALFVIAQCGGGIAGAGFLYGVNISGYRTNLETAISHSTNVSAWERFGIEFILTFVVVLTYFVSMDTHRRWTTSSNITIGAAYSACSFVSIPYLNPARSLGPSFVLSKWDNHWVYWLGPAMGGAASGLIYEYLLNPKRQRKTKSADGDTSSMNSDADTYDDLEKTNGNKLGSNYNSYRPPGGTTANALAAYCPSVASTSLYSAPPTKLERVDSLYGNSKSLYCKSPPLTRANLNRSQSVYAKSNSYLNRETLPRPGPLVPAQSLYPIRLNPGGGNNQQAENAQNQQRTEAYNNSNSNRDRNDGYNSNTVERREYYRNGNYDSVQYDENEKRAPRSTRPESLYGSVNGNQRRGGGGGQSAPSDDSNYGGGSYGGFSNRKTSGTYNGRTVTGAEVRQSPNSQY
ncbi:neurogenic protein big brain [Onthophagus taurus]|uniref:neurogenic protein big brain n=1 Tax=Onthophagus taurus TaxID=166361 RepID=UPI000C200AF4|nr:neurogenic protein big brain [Onthophagus taurus]